MNQVNAAFSFAGAAACAALLCTSALHAQPAAPASAAAGASEPAAEGEAMRRAERLANNPLRAILEAGKIQRRAGGEAVAKPVAAAPAATEAVPAALQAAAAPRPTPAEGMLTATGLLTEPAAAQQPAWSMPATAPAEPMAAGTLPQTATLAPPVAAAAQPQLLSQVEPVIPTRLLAEIGDVTRVWFDLSLRADGSVAEATLLPPAPRQLQRVLAPILLQWRYAPLPRPQLHRVELVFN